MLIEAESIPYDAARLLGERLLVLAPHPDDEVIGCGGLVAQHLREGRAVRVLVATDGVEAASPSEDRQAYRDQREEESRQALALLGTAELHFLRFADRALDPGVTDRIAGHLREFKPDLICVPSPVEIHPDHLALSRAFCDLVQRDRTLFADLAVTRIAFYEVSHPLRPNTLVDITEVADRKYQAISAHQSQMKVRDYVSCARGLNAYRALTLPPGTRFAEGYWVIALSDLRTTPFSALRSRIGGPPIEVIRETLPISVIIRTRDRHKLLQEAITSVRGNAHPAEIVVVNDGGASPRVDASIQLVEHGQTAGRSAAMNSGVRAATTPYIAFLDDDDLFYPEHLATLSACALATPNRAAWYSDAVSAFLAVGTAGGYEERSRLRLFASDFDRELLLMDNYIPLPTLLVTRQNFLDAGGFDSEFDLFEDWDFLIRLSKQGDFAHVPRVTCEIRHFEGGGSIVLDAPEGSRRFRDAKLQIWKKHASVMDDDLIANVFERQKRRTLASEALWVEEKGLRALAGKDQSRLEREKTQLIAEIQALHNSINERTIYIKELEMTLETLRRDGERAGSETLTLRKSLQDAQAVGRAAYAEIDRLQGLLAMIYRSRTWKLHALMERMRGRG